MKSWVTLTTDTSVAILPNELEFITELKSIGFKLIEDSRKFTGAGYTEEYKYYPSYFTDRHYTMVVFRSANVLVNSDDPDYIYQVKNECDFRLYIHRNDGGYISSQYQSKLKYNISKHTDIFKAEFRQKKLDSLIDICLITK